MVFVWTNPTTVIGIITQLLQLAYQASALLYHLQRILLKIRIFFKQLTQLLRAFLEDACNIGDLSLHFLQLLLVHYACETCTPFDQFCILEFIILLVFEQLADLEASQLAADIVLRLDVVEEFE